MRLGLISAFAAFLSVVLAQIEIVSPASGSTGSLSGGRLQVRYSGAGADVAVLIISVMAGGDSEETAGVLGSGTANTPAGSGTIPVTVAEGPSDENAYFIRVQANLASGGQSITYSNRFSINGMSGAFPAAGTMTSEEVEAAYRRVGDDVAAVPAATDGVAPPAVGAAATGDILAYSLQTDGASKMAPMQQMPPTRITKTDLRPLHPTTSARIATTQMSTPQFRITLTASNTHTARSRPNTNAPQPHPTDDMQKFLNRWRD